MTLEMDRQGVFASDGLGLGRFDSLPGDIQLKIWEMANQSFVADAAALIKKVARGTIARIRLFGRNIQDLAALGLQIRPSYRIDPNNPIRGLFRDPNPPRYSLREKRSTRKFITQLTDGNPRWFQRYDVRYPNDIPYPYTWL